ncbi:Alpha/beta hydrolase family protein [Stieleria neptunia]|uniref:Alpha/beta hydrolase family protein n=1 Tax=Stieleria neptunia TaxID=2527979 RepID=A0A518HIY9_9BACT|nr:acetylhydrolase [Stieleria neptunia]QDV40821.1 Alpha/beta hydrolase family protein [Stieleria neptunia]
MPLVQTQHSIGPQSRRVIAAHLIMTGLLSCLVIPSGLMAQSPSLIKPIDFEPRDPKRDREVPVRVYLPAGATARPVVLFSHGLGGSREGNPYLGQHWAGAGFVAVFIQHAGSDRDVMKNVPLRERFNALKNAASYKSARDRLEDVSFVIDQLEQWNQRDDHPLFGKLDLEHIGMSGHSFGAVTTLGVAGQQSFFGRRIEEPRIDAFLAMSPQPGKGPPPEKAFAPLKRPLLCMTGTQDDSPIDPTFTPESRQLVYKALPEGDKYHLVFQDGNHYTFSDARGLRRRDRNPKHHPAIQKISVKFWQAYLLDDADAKGWLQSDAAHTDGTLDPPDVWQWK